MVMVTKVYKLVVKLMVLEASHNPHIKTLDEACAPLTIDPAYILWENKWLLQNSSGNT
jgi:hypothetical protein